MTAKLNDFRRRKNRRWWLGGATLIVLAISSVILVAASSADLTSSPFEGSDGNMIVDHGGTDWASFSAPVLKTLIDTPTGPDDNSFTQGTHEDDPNVTIATGSIPPNKNDLQRAYLVSEPVGSETFLYLAWERLVNTGSANIDFELNQVATPNWDGTTTGALTVVRTEGDILITYDFGGSGNPDLGLLTWLTPGFGHSNSDCEASGGKLPCWGNRVDLGPTGVPSAVGAVNTDTIDEPLIGGGATLDAGLFGEAKIDLSLIPGLTSTDPCKSFGNMFVKSRSSGSSIDAELKDFIAPAPIHVSNCATLKVVKHSVGGTGTFAFAGTGSPTPTPVPASQVAFSGFNIDTSTGQNGIASQQFAGFKPGSQYTVAESGPPSGWQFTSVACTDDNTGNAVGSGSGAQGVAFTPTTDEAITCTFTNTKQGTLTVNKVLAPAADSGKFNLQINGSTAGTGGNVGNGGTTGAVPESPGAYTVGETAVAGTTLSNYVSVISGDCAANGTITLAAGQNAVCTITNTRKPTLTVNKVLAPAADSGKFNLQINGQTAGTGANVGNGGTTGAVVETVGSYTVGEAAGTATSLSNYTSAITGDCAADGSITLAAGQNAVCTITNTKKGTIAVKKVTVPSPNATDSFSFTGDVAASLMDGQTSTPVTVTPGTYSSVEGAAPGFDLTSISCNDANSATPSSGVVGTRTATFKVDPGESVVCTFTNTRQTGTIVLKKHWVGTPGTTTLSIDQGQTNITSKSVSSDDSTDKKTVPTGNYTVSEAGGLASYASSLACFNDNGAGGGTADNGTKDGGEPTVVPSNATSTSGTVAVGNGDHIVCTLTNTRAQGSVELKKTWVGTAGNVTLKIGTAPLGQEVAHTALTGTDGTTGPQPVNTGTYFVSETINSPTDAANYSSVLACFNDANNNGTQDGEEQAVTPNEQGGFDVASGDHVICTFTNRELPQLKLVKSLDPSTDDGTFDFAIDQQSFDNGGDGYGDTGTTGFVHIQPGAPVISETGHGDTDLSAYDSSISCINEDSTDGTSLDMSALTYGDKVTCTFTNHRLPTITIGKRLLPASDTGTFDFTVDPGEGQLVLNNDGSGFGNNDSVEVIVSTGTHTVTESGHGNTLGADYSSSWSCSNEQSGTGTSIDLNAVGYGDNIVCTFTNTKLATLIVVKNVDNSNGGGSKGPGDFSIHVSTGGLDLPGSPAAGSSTGTTYSGLLPGTYKVGEDAVSGYNLTGISGCLADGSVVLQAGATVTCTLTNTSNAPPPPPPPPPPAPKIDLQITKSASPNPATLGGNVTWTMVVTNNGPNGATGVTVADPLPAGTTFVSVASSQGTCTNGAVVSCQLGSMAVGTSVTITLVTGTTTVGTITNTATTVGNEAETNTANNTATATDVVNGAFVPPVKPVVYCTALAVSPKSLFVGRKNTLTMKVSQHGKAVKGIKVKIKGSSLKVTTKGSNANGVVKQSVRPMKAGIVTFSPVAHSSCKNPRIGVIGVFTPPVTG